MCNSIKTSKILKEKFNQVRARFTVKSTKLLKEIEEDLNIKTCWIHGLEDNLIKISLLPKSTYGPIAIPVKIPADFFPEIAKLILKFI